MDRKEHVFGIIWMIFMLILSVLMGISMIWIPTIIVIIWVICPFVLKLCGLDEASNLIPNILFAVLYGMSSFDILSYIAFLEAFIGFLAATGYDEFVYELVDDIRSKKRTKLIGTVRMKIQQKIDVYKKIADILAKVEGRRQVDNLIELLALSSNQAIRETYIERCNEQNIALLRKIEKIQNQNMLGLNIHDKTISEIKKDVAENLDALHTREKILETCSTYELKHYNI